MISVLRLGHRVARDPRISTHCGLVSRALGASEIIYTGEHDETVMESIQDITERWGGPFSTRFEKDWKKCVAAYKKKGFKIVHLTMYGIPLQKAKMKKYKKVLVVIGGEKVPPEMYQLADYNIAITNQPHSEVAALAVFLSNQCKERKFRNARIRIIPQERGKKVIEAGK